MTRCQAVQRRQVRRARRDLAERSVVIAADLVPPQDGAGWQLALLLDHQGVPPGVLSALAGYGLTVETAGEGEGCWRVLASAQLVARNCQIVFLPSCTRAGLHVG